MKQSKPGFLWVNVRRIGTGLLATLLAGLLGAACASGPPSAANELVIFAAASLIDAFDELTAAFEADHPGTHVTINYGGSSQLAVQLMEGAHADIFASANNRQMEIINERGYVLGEPVIFATNRLVVIMPANNPAHIETLNDLAQPGVRLVMAGPDVPVREYADLMLAQMRASPAFGDAFYQDVYANLVSEEDNVRRVVTKIVLGEADAGIVYASDLAGDGDVLLHLDVPDAYNVRAVYPLAILSETSRRNLAELFVDFVLSARGQAILARWGFLAPGPPGDIGDPP